LDYSFRGFVLDVGFMEKKIKIVFENNDFLVLEKGSGIITTKEGRDDNTVEDYLRVAFFNNLPRNGIIHRLDKGTSGLLLVARNNESFDNLKRQFKDRTVVKKYYCLTCGEVVGNGSVNLPIGRSKYGFGKFGVTIDGKRALTEFKLLKKYVMNGKKYSLLEINLKTGRTHQIRVHLSHLRWPLVGDVVYGGEANGLGRPFLHASYLEIDDPKMGGKRLVFKSSLPMDLKNHLKLYEEI
jgi:23S rRNA pseudouridine1911/1915/1917 synthase